MLLTPLRQPVQLDTVVEDYLTNPDCHLLGYVDTVPGRRPLCVKIVRIAKPSNCTSQH